MLLTLFQAVLYFVMGLQTAQSHDVLTAVLMAVGLLTVLALSLIVETPAARIGVPVCAAIQIGSGLLLAVLLPFTVVPSYLPMAAEHLLIGCSTLFLRSEADPDREKHTLNSMS